MGPEERRRRGEGRDPPRVDIGTSDILISNRVRTTDRPFFGLLASLAGHSLRFISPGDHSTLHSPRP